MLCQFKHQIKQWRRRGEDWLRMFWEMGLRCLRQGAGLEHWEEGSCSPREGPSKRLGGCWEDVISEFVLAVCGVFLNIPQILSTHSYHENSYLEKEEPVGRSPPFFHNAKSLNLCWVYQHLWNACKVPCSLLGLHYRARKQSWASKCCFHAEILT
jgi:hypothetical protein